jgi:hypothetical protein
MLVGDACPPHEFIRHATNNKAPPSRGAKLWRKSRAPMVHPLLQSYAIANSRAVGRNPSTAFWRIRQAPLSRHNCRSDLMR